MRALKSLRSKFVRTMLLVTGIIGISTLAIVVGLSAQAASAEHPPDGLKAAANSLRRA